MRTLKESFREAGFVIVVFAAVVIVLFLTNLPNTVPSITGEAITFPGMTPPPPRKPVQPVIVDEHMDCFKNVGLNTQDLTLLTSLLRDVPCTIGQPQQVIATRQNGCADLTINNKVQTTICAKNNKPQLNMKVDYDVVQVPGSQPRITQTKKYDIPFYILFYTILILIILLYKQILMATHDFKDPRKSHTRTFTPPAPPTKKPVVYLKAPVWYEEKKENKPSKVQELLKQRKQEYRNVRIKILYSRFQEIAQEAHKSIVSGNLAKAQQHYTEVFDIYTRLVIRVGREERALLDDTMQYLSKYLGTLHIATTPTKKVNQPPVSLRESHEPLRPRPRLLTQEDLAHLREQIAKKDYGEARKIFSTLTKSTPPTRSSQEQPDILEKIDVTHHAFREHSKIPLDKEDTRTFMNNLTKLREQLIKNKSKKG